MTSPSRIFHPLASRDVLPIVIISSSWRIYFLFYNIIIRRAFTRAFSIFCKAMWRSFVNRSIMVLTCFWNFWSHTIQLKYEVLVYLQYEMISKKLNFLIYKKWHIKILTRMNAAWNIRYLFKYECAILTVQFNTVFYLYFLIFQFLSIILLNINLIWRRSVRVA